ncbi:MAG: DNA polymerase III subunit beta, partial [Clostridia bacterium]
MRFACTVSDLNAGLATVTRALATRSASPILEGVLLETCPEGLRLLCTDLALGIETHVDAQVEEDGRVVLPGKLLTEIIRKLPAERVSVSINATHTASIRCAGSRTTIAGLSANEYPELPEVEGEPALSLPQNQWKKMIQTTCFAIATDETRPILTGCLLETEKDELHMVALDGFRLAMQKYATKTPETPITAVVPGKMLTELGKILTDTTEPVELRLSASHLVADIGPTRVVTRLLEGEFIRYHQILPADYQTQIQVSCKALETAIDRASLIAREGKNNLVRFHIEEQSLLITSNAELGDVREELPIQSEGRDLDIAFNVRYI